ncbi:MAG: hypothetical protein U0573_02910 [Phycisphaerales bacterium]|nr:hypothetical protein [Planctomycetota bacterium]
MRHAFVGVGIVLACMISPFAHAGSFSDDFSAGLRPAFWNVTQTLPNQYVVQSSGSVVHMYRPAANNPGGLQVVAVNLNMGAICGTVGGDFSASIDFANANISLPGLNQVELHALFTDGTFFFNVFDNSSGLNTHIWNGSVLAVTPRSSNAGKLTIERIGSTLSAKYNGVTFGSLSSAAHLRSLIFTLQNNTGSNSLISCDYDNFSFTFAKPCRADLDLDAQVDDKDFSLFVVAYNLLDCADPTMPAGCPADLNSDGFVDDADFVLFVAAYDELLCP